LVVPAFFTWAAIHELAHYFAARAQRSLTLATFKIYPHKRDGRFVWASVSWDYAGPDMTPRELAWVYAAPRVPDAFAVVLAPLAGFMPEPWMAATWLVLFGAGLVDLAVGSMGISPESDLRRWAREGAIAPWVLRAGGWSFVIGSAGLAIAGVIMAPWGP